MKNKQNTIIKRKSGIYLNKKKKTAKAVLILTVLCCLFSTITQATEIHKNATNITSIKMYGYDESISSQAWRQYTFEIIDENTIKTQSIVYGQSMQKIELTYNNIYTESIKLEFEYKVLYASTEQYADITENGNPTIGIYYPYKGGNIEFNQITPKKIKYSYKTNNINHNTNKIEIFTSISLVSAYLYIENFSIIINDEVYKVVNTIENEIDNIEDNAQQAHEAVTNDEYEYDDPTLAIRATHTSVNNAIQYISEHIYSLDNLVLYDSIFSTSPTIYLVFMLSLTFALLSYVLFGKVI